MSPDNPTQDETQGAKVPSGNRPTGRRTGPAAKPAARPSSKPASKSSPRSAAGAGRSSAPGTTRRAPERDEEPPYDDDAQGQPGGASRAGLSVDSVAEASVLGACLSDPDVYYELGDLLVEEDFGVASHRVVWKALVTCDLGGKPLDVVTVADELTRSGDLARAGGRERLDALVAEVPAHLDHTSAHAAIIKERALARRVLRAAREIAGEAAKPGVRGDAALEYAEQTVFEIGHRPQGSSLVMVGEAVPGLLEDIAKARSSLLLGHSTGFTELDKRTGGVQGGQLIVVAARPGMGKSALALQMARNVAETSGDTVAVFSYEMATSELLIRMLAGALAVPVRDLRSGNLPHGAERDLALATTNMSGLNLCIDDSPPQTIGGLRSAVRRLARRTKLSLVVVDYIQLMSGDTGRGRDENRTQEIGQISRGLKMLAREIDAPVVALSQLSRAVESRPNKRPLLSDLRESGSIEQDADTVWFLYRPSAYYGDADPLAAELIIGKQRQGATGAMPLRFEGSCVRFKDAPPGTVVGNDGGGGGGGSAPRGGYF